MEKVEFKDTKGLELHKPLAFLGRTTLPTLVAAACLFASLAISESMRTAQIDKLEATYRHRRDNLRSFLLTPPTTAFSNEMIRMLRELRDVAPVSSTVDHDSFDAVIDPRRSYFGNAISGLWVAKVEREERSAYEAVLGGPLMNRTGGPVDARSRSAHYPVAYVYPPLANGPKTGVDLGSDPWLRTAIEATEATGAPVAAARLSMDGPSNVGWMDWFRLLPVYDQESTGELIGFVVIRSVSLRDEFKRMFSPALGGLRALAIHSEDLPLHVELPSLEDEGWPIGVARRWRKRPIEHASKLIHDPDQWWLVTQPDPELLRETLTPQPALVLVGGAIGSLLLWLYLVTLIGRREKVRAVVHRRTWELEKTKLELECLLNEHLLDLEMFRESEERFRALFAKAPDACVLIDLQGRFREGNEATLELLGYKRSDIVGRDLREIGVLSEDQIGPARAILRRVISGQLTGQDNLILVAKDGRQVPVEVRTQLVSVSGQELALVIARDISERVRFEEERTSIQERLNSAQRLEALGTLAGGVAHDFNNLLAAVVGYVELLRPRAGHDHEIAEVIDVIESVARRAGQLTRNLLGFARSGKHLNTMVDLHDLICEMSHLLRPVLDERINVKLDLRAGSHCVQGDPNQLEQIILNLLLNARDAIEGQGEIQVATEVVHLQPDTWAVAAEVPAGDYIVLSVTDSGKGIPPEILRRIFEPFFTTKPNNEGSGMGLATVFGIVKNHGGAIEAESELGEKTVFRVFLPAQEGQCIQSRASTKRTAARAEACRVLIIDDQELVLRSIAGVLRTLGYEARTETSPVAAVEWFREHADEVDLVIMDMVMPKMSGMECFSELKRVRPDVRVVLMTGYGRDGTVQEVLDMGAFAFLEKPDGLKKVGDVVSTALGLDTIAGKAAS